MTNDILDRIIQFTNVYDLSNSEFANVINISRSTVSHVLSGRNKPSLDFVLKIKKAYDNLSLDWLLEGNGPMFTQEEIKNIDEEVTQKTTKIPPVEKKTKKVPKEIINEINPLVKEVINNQTSVQETKEASPSNGKRVEKIIVFYSDHTFDVYHK